MKGKKYAVSASSAQNGFTLVELIITVVVSGILFYFIGMLMLTSQASFLRAGNQVAVEDDLRYAKTRLSYIIRNSTGPIINSGTAVVPVLEMRRLSDNAFETVYRDSVKSELRLNIKPGGTPEELILSNVTSFGLVLSGASGKNSAVQITIGQNNKGIIKSGSFTVKCRNVE